ncbi:hypothetical protein MTO96_025719 [Rhipicephalus appendiculatus]
MSRASHGFGTPRSRPLLSSSSISRARCDFAGPEPIGVPQEPDRVPSPRRSSPQGSELQHCVGNDLLHRNVFPRRACEPRGKPTADHRRISFRRAHHPALLSSRLSEIYLQTSTALRVRAATTPTADANSELGLRNQKVALSD